MVPRTTLTDGERRSPRVVPRTTRVVPQTTVGGPTDLSRVVPQTTDQALDQALEHSPLARPANTRMRVVPQTTQETMDAGRPKVKSELMTGERVWTMSYVLGRLGLTDVSAGVMSDLELWQRILACCKSSGRKADDWFMTVRGYQIQRRRRPLSRS